MDDPLGLESAGHALFDMIPDRRGNLFGDEIYRLSKALDSTTNLELSPSSSQPQLLPPNNKFSTNDVVLLTWQPLGSGDIFDARNLPTSGTAISTEARVVATGPTYVDLALPAGMMEATFGGTSLVDDGISDLAALRLRVDRFFSDVPYRRMVEAVTCMSTIPNRRSTPKSGLQGEDQQLASAAARSKRQQRSHNTNERQQVEAAVPAHANICMDDMLREAIISTHSFSDPASSLFHDMDACDLQSLGRLLAKPPMPTSVKLANEVLTYVQANSNTIFKPLNAPQLAAVGAALTRKLSLIQGPPGTGKTNVASVIGFGFTHQCRSISSNAKVLATAFSNVGADNLAEEFLQLGLKVVRIGKASAVSQNLWVHTLDAAIARDPDAQRALDLAARATAALSKIRTQKRRKGESTGGSNGMLNERVAQEKATAAVKQSIKACNVAATKAFREADIVVSTSTGAADPRLLAACGLNVDLDSLMERDGSVSRSQRPPGSASMTTSGATSLIAERTDAPDGLPPLSLPFVIVDEACQSVEPGTLVPLTASNSCRSLVLLGDPCQLPATVKSTPDSPLSISLMERLAATLPAPMIKMKDEITDMDPSFIDDLPAKQAKSLVRSMGESPGDSQVSYRKRFAGSLLLSIQYRMHPSIAALPSSIFYDGLLSTPSNLASQRPFPPLLTEIMPCGNPDLNVNVRFVHVGGRCNEKLGDGNKGRALVNSNALGQETTSYQNESEALRIVDLVKRMLFFDQQYDPQGSKKIGIVTPYNGQVQLIRSLLDNDKEISSLLSSLSASVEVNSVDGFQGRERDVILFSAVRSNRRGNIGFLSDWRRLNVALTRAKSALLVVGDMDTLGEGDRHWAAFIKWCRGTNCVVDETQEVEACVSL